MVVVFPLIYPLGTGLLTSGSIGAGPPRRPIAGDIIHGYCDVDSICTTVNNNPIGELAGSYAATGTANNGWSMSMSPRRVLTKPTLSFDPFR